MDLSKKIAILDELAWGSLSITHVGPWLVHAYRNDTQLGNESIYAPTLMLAVDRALKKALNLEEV